MKNLVKVVLCGKEYRLQTEDAPSYVYQLAKTLEKRISDITEKNRQVSAHSAVMMVALSALDELTKANNSVEVIRSQVKEYVDEAGKARLERDAALREIDTLRAKIEQLENLIRLRDLRESGQAEQTPGAQSDAEPAEQTPAEESDGQLPLTEA